MTKPKFNVRTRRIPGRRPKATVRNPGVIRQSAVPPEKIDKPHHYIDDLACAALLINEERCIEAANEGFYKLFGLPAKAIQGGETFAAFAQRAVLNRYDGILDLGNIIGDNNDKLPTQIEVVNVRGQSVTAQRAATPDDKTLISFATNQPLASSRKTS
ncbi:MAG: hypothetical protein GKS01_14120 [Alphaproteobacteria bacterium]|nr:hypothetical protein [Alphaproteobacteria bacterium]